MQRYGLTWTVLLAAFMTCFGSSFLIGYNLAILNLPAPHVKDFLGRTILNLKDSQTTDGFVNPAFLYAQVSTTFVVAGAIGAFSCGWVAELLGRRNGLLFNHLIAILGGLLCAPCVYANSAVLLFVGRFVIGVNCGITIGLGSIYLAEIAPRKLRGAFGAGTQLAITTGIAMAYVATLTRTLNTTKLWPIACALSAVPAAISLIFLPFCPESPRFLLVKRNNELAAREAFSRLNSKDDVDTLVGELREEMELAKNQDEFRFIQLFTQKDLRMAVLLACLIQVSQQLAGINAVVSYSSTMLKTAGIADDYIQYCVLAIGVLNFIMTILSLPLMERAGRRTLLLWPTVVLAASLLLLTITVNIATTSQSESVKQSMGIFSALLILVYISGFSLGLGPVPALIVSELFRQAPRAAAYSLSQSLQWLSNLVVQCSYPSIDKAIKGYSFLPFLVVTVVCWVFFFLFMPETRNRKFDDIARDLALGTIVVGRRDSNLRGHATSFFRKKYWSTSSSGQTRERQPIPKLNSSPSDEENST